MVPIYNIAARRMSKAAFATVDFAHVLPGRNLAKHSELHSSRLFKTRRPFTTASSSEGLMEKNCGGYAQHAQPSGGDHHAKDEKRKDDILSADLLCQFAKVDSIGYDSQVIPHKCDICGLNGRRHRRQDGLKTSFYRGILSAWSTTSGKCGAGWKTARIGATEGSS